EHEDDRPAASVCGHSALATVVHENQPARRIFSRSRSAFVNVTFIAGRVTSSLRTSRIERMRRWMRSQGCCQARDESVTTPGLSILAVYLTDIGSNGRVDWRLSGAWGRTPAGAVTHSPTAVQTTREGA